MKILIALLALMPVIVIGVPEPVIIGLQAESDSYTVPEGKVLLIEKIFANGANRSVEFQLINTTTNTIYLPYSAYTSSIKYDPPLKIPAGTVIRANLSNYGPIIFGILVAPSDLYVRLDSEVSDIIAANGLFMFDIQTSSPKPVRVSVRSSSDLKSWQSANATVRRTGADTYSVVLPADKESYFAKYSVTDRK